MSRCGRFVSFLVAVILLLALGHRVDGATVSLRAVKVNGLLYTGSNNLAVAPGDEIQADIFLSGWGTELPGGVRSFQIQLAGIAGAQSGANGTVLPKGWVAPLNPETCTDKSECLDPRYPLCEGVCGCRGAAHNPSLGALDRHGSS